ncbi:uncharacterized protein LOC143208824 [Lasioglossum baleicum]|uniref:uncharacterized protein LOC143208824 n=1 Tax=Lasioglossum baleicum TaxID=434251 RepID=UPI003FCDB93C
MPFILTDVEFAQGSMSPTISPVLVLSVLLLSPVATEDAIDPFALIRETLKYWRRIYKMYQEEVALGYCWAEYFLRLGQTARNPPSAQSASPNVANFQINRGNLFASTRSKRSRELIDPENDNGTKIDLGRTATLLRNEHRENQWDTRSVKCLAANRSRRNISNPPCKFEVTKFSEKDEKDVSARNPQALGTSFESLEEKNHRLSTVLASLTATQRITVVTSGNSPVQSLFISTKSREVTDQRSRDLAEQDGADGPSPSVKRVVETPSVLEFKGTEAEGGPELGWKLKGPEADTRRKVLRSRGSDGTSGFAFSLARSRPGGLESVLSPRRVVFVGDSRFKGRNAMRKLDDEEGPEDFRRERTGEELNVKSWGERAPRMLRKRQRKLFLECTSKNQGFQRRSLAFEHETPISKRKTHKERRMRNGNGSWRTRNDFGYVLEAKNSFSMKKKGFWPRERLMNTGGDNWESLKQLLKKNNRYRIGAEGSRNPVRYPLQAPSLLAVTRQRFMGDYGSPTSGTSRNSIQSQSLGDQGRRSLSSFIVARGLVRMSGILYDLRTVFMAFLRVLRMMVRLGWDVVDYIDTNMALACTKDYLMGKAIEWIDS